MSKAIQLPDRIGDGKDREVRVLFEDQSRKLVLIRLRRGAILADHSARFPITIQTIVGKGVLRVGKEEHALVPGVIVPVDAHAVHNVQGDPDVAILVSFFRQSGGQKDDDTTARFD
jgi:quercetin dioxygenase-like cupin family protein